MAPHSSADAVPSARCSRICGLHYTAPTTDPSDGHMAILSGGNKVAVTAGTRVKVFDVVGHVNGRETKIDMAVSTTERLRGKDRATVLACHPSDPNLLLCGATDKSLKLVDLRTNNFAMETTLPKKAISVSWSCDGNRAAVSTEEEAISILDARSGSINATRAYRDTYPNLMVNGATFTSSKPDILFSVSGVSRSFSNSTHPLGFLDILEAKQAENSVNLLMRLEAHAATCVAVFSDATDSNICTVGREGVLVVWDGKSLTPKYSFSDNDVIRGGCIQRSGKNFVWTEGPRLNVHSMETGSLVAKADVTSMSGGRSKYSSMQSKESVLDVSFHPEKENMLLFTCSEGGLGVAHVDC